MRTLRRSPAGRASPLLTSAATACDEAFRTIARQYLHMLAEQQRATMAGNAEALHKMRIALTRLRTVIAFFSPMVDGHDRSRIAAELKWLNAHLGIVRDLDVAIERLAKSGTSGAAMKPWKEERAACQRHLSHALHSRRYRRLLGDIAGWIETGSWSAKRGRKAADRRSLPIGEYGAQRLNHWRNRLVKKSSKLEEAGARKRHRVRLFNKKISYAIDAIARLLPNDDIARQAARKQLRTAQKSLGQLNDAARYRELAGALGNGRMTTPDRLLGPKRKKRLLKKAADAYREFARLKPFREPKAGANNDSKFDAAAPAYTINEA